MPRAKAQPKAPPAKKAAPKAAAEPAPAPDVKPPYTEVVKYEAWSERGKKFSSPKEGVWAWRKMIPDGKGQDQLCFFVRTRDVAAAGLTPVGSRITDAAGDVWIVTRSNNATPNYACFVKKAD